jgi:hypothetical protein
MKLTEYYDSEKHPFIYSMVNGIGAGLIGLAIFTGPLGWAGALVGAGMFSFAGLTISGTVIGIKKYAEARADVERANIKIEEQKREPKWNADMKAEMRKALEEEKKQQHEQIQELKMSTASLTSSTSTEVKPPEITFEEKLIVLSKHRKGKYKFSMLEENPENKKDGSTRTIKVKLDNVHNIGMFAEEIKKHFLELINLFERDVIKPVIQKEKYHLTQNADYEFTITTVDNASYDKMKEFVGKEFIEKSVKLSQTKVNNAQLFANSSRDPVSSSPKTEAPLPPVPPPSPPR